MVDDDFQTFFFFLFVFCSIFIAMHCDAQYQWGVERQLLWGCSCAILFDMPITNTFKLKVHSEDVCKRILI